MHLGQGDCLPSTLSLFESGAAKLIKLFISSSDPEKTEKTEKWVALSSHLQHNYLLKKSVKPWDSVANDPIFLGQLWHYLQM